MLSEQEILIEGEHVTGRYQAEIARWKNNTWVSTIPPIYILTTDQRLVIQAQTRKHYEPATIPARMLQTVERLETPRQGLILTLKDGQQLTIFIALHRDSSIINRINALINQPAISTRELRAVAPPYQFPLPPDYLQKLIDFVETM